MGSKMTRERIRGILQKIADGAPRNDFNGHSLASLERRGLVRFAPVTDPISRAVLGVNLYLTSNGRIELDRLTNLHGEIRPDSAVGNEFPNQEPAPVRRG